MGAGKTTLTRGIADGLGVAASSVSSPTFVLINVYEVPSRSPNAFLGGGTLIHADAYRLTSPEDLDSAGWDHLFESGMPRGRAAALIEWPSRIESHLPGAEHAVCVEIVPTAASSRRITLRIPESWRERPGFDVFEARPPSRCPVTKKWVSPLAPAWPFFDERARMADLYGWMSNSYSTQRPLEPEDVQEENL